ncbi:sulfite exporter TauE/SafE family protein [Streptomyces sp. MNU76]|uniref:sulfite exporter TauE/SafE family protein n=1 Tax=Streptomyces sp. MNU76 TaxID=2560026 RepID=UPI001E2BB9D3|nr:sulfite exporter TauE/SafE family protein [Streptomyces sp. MNU76]MCC9710646.1 sulfite exporter TauE/SafE family protein [Streptomyces sp. MNU76]
MEALQVIAIVVAAFGTAVLSAVAGFGGGVLLLPVFVAVLGTRDAVAVLTVAQLASNSSRVWFNRHDVDRRLVGIFALGAVPAAVAGALLFATAPLPALTRLIGVFLLVMVVWRRFKPHAARLDDRTFAAVGAASGFGSALVGSVGPMVAPFFLARGLLKGAYIGTEAASAVVMHLTKLVVFGAAAVLTASNAVIGLALAPASTAGAWTGKKIVDRLPAHVFVIVVEIGLITSGLLLAVTGG